MDNQEVKALVKRYLDGECSAEEEALLETWYLQYEDKDIHELTTGQLESIERSLPGKYPAPVRRLWTRIAAAASVILCLSAAAYLLLHHRTTQQFAQYHNDVKPGRNKAILKLGSGKTIVISDSQNGTLARQGNTTILKSAGEVSYNSQSIALVYDTLQTPRGGQIQLALADGTKVWLNADTKLRYPENFSGKDRTVELISGEAYFEVVHDSKQPFKVITHNQIVRDMGTRFNINAYDDEPAAKTTLVEGAVTVNSKLLNPGQQAVTSNNITTISAADTEEALAWKNGLFMFGSEDIRSVMRKIERWYDVSVEYQGALPAENYSGSFSRFANVSTVLGVLEKTKTVHFRIEGRRIIVMK